MTERVVLNSKGSTRFKAGEARPRNSGRRKGTPNKTTRLIREAIVMAAEAAGEDGKGKGQLVGYLTRIAKKHPETFCVLLGRVLPMQLNMTEHRPEPPRTMAEAAARLEAEGIPLYFDSPIGQRFVSPFAPSTPEAEKRLREAHNAKVKAGGGPLTLAEMSAATRTLKH